MMKYLTTLFACVFISSMAVSQYDAFTFQSLLLDVHLNPIANAKVDLRTTISSDAASNNIYYQELQELSSSPSGTIAFAIGSGTAISGQFSNIDWLAGIPYINVAYDLGDGKGWQDTGTSRFSSVPFCLESKYVFCLDGSDGETGDQGPQGQTGNPGLHGGAPIGPQGYPGPPVIYHLSTPPSSPQEGRVYLDDGTNTPDGKPGFRYFDGSGWIEL